MKLQPFSATLSSLYIDLDILLLNSHAELCTNRRVIDPNSGHCEVSGNSTMRGLTIYLNGIPLLYLLSHHITACTFGVIGSWVPADVAIA